MQGDIHRFQRTEHGHLWGREHYSLPYHMVMIPYDMISHHIHKNKHISVDTTYIQHSMIYHIISHPQNMSICLYHIISTSLEKCYKENKSGMDGIL